MRYVSWHVVGCCAGVRLLVLNSSLLIHPDLVPELADTQHTWLLEELEQCKLCAMQVAIFSYHSFFEPEGQEDSEPDDSTTK